MDSCKELSVISGELFVLVLVVLSIAIVKGVIWLATSMDGPYRK